MNIDFNLLKKFVGKRLRFEITYLFNDDKVFNGVFYAILKEVIDDYIVVEQTVMQSDENFENEEAVLNNRKLIKGNFSTSKETPLNG